MRGSEHRAGLPARLRNFVEKAAQATLVGDVFDDAATGQGLLNYFVRGLSSGAITGREAEATGLTHDELQGKSFLTILDARREGHDDVDQRRPDHQLGHENHSGDNGHQAEEKHHERGGHPAAEVR